MHAATGLFKIEHVKGATGFEDAPDLVEELPLPLGGQVVVHKRRENPIERPVGIRERIPEPLVKLHGDPCTRRLAPRPGKSFGVGVQPDHRDIRMQSLDTHGQGSRAAAYFKDALSRLWSRLLDERSVGGIAPEQFHEGIVKRKQPVVSGCRKIPLGRLAHDFIFSLTLYPVF
jgi:hypothetical protein